MVLVRTMGEIQPPRNFDLIHYTIEGTAVELELAEKGKPDQIYQIRFPTSLGYQEALETFRYIASIETPEEGVFPSVYRDPNWREQRLNVGLTAVERVDIKSQLLFLNLPNKYFGFEECPETGSHFGFASTEKRVPEYLPEVIQRFGVDVPQETLNSVFSQFERELVS